MIIPNCTTYIILIFRIETFIIGFLYSQIVTRRFNHWVMTKSIRKIWMEWQLWQPFWLNLLLIRHSQQCKEIGSLCFYYVCVFLLLDIKFYWKILMLLIITASLRSMYTYRFCLSHSFIYIYIWFFSFPALWVGFLFKWKCLALWNAFISHDHVDIWLIALRLIIYVRITEKMSSLYEGVHGCLGNNGHGCGS